MSRSGYTDDLESEWALIKWRGQVASAIRGRRGQAFLREMLEALDAMPQRRLIAHDLQLDGDVCAIGSVGVKRGVNMAELDPADHYRLAATFGIAQQLVREIEYLNDEADGMYWTVDEAPEQRWQRMRDWIKSQLIALKVDRS